MFFARSLACAFLDLSSIPERTRRNVMTIANRRDIEVDVH
jgi:hypothetical protein